MTKKEQTAKALALIEEGTKEQNWGKVEEGKALLASKPERKLRAKKVASPQPDSDGGVLLEVAKESRTGGGGRVLPFEAPKGNRFKDDRRVAASEIKTTEVINATVRKSDPRDPYKAVIVRCVKCQKKEDVHPDLVKRDEDGDIFYVCSKCIKASSGD